MFGKLAKIFRSDELVASTAVFPDINSERLARELGLKAEGATRGKEDQPETGAQILDHVERKAINRVEALRRRGLDNFETNRRVYAERLNQAAAARMLVETEASDARARFAEEVTKWKARMVTPREHVQETYRWRAQFRKENGIGERPARPATPWRAIIGLALLMILLESAVNAYLFSQNNPLGLLGGLMAAVLISCGNVVMSMTLGMAMRHVNCRGLRNLMKRFCGFLCIPGWIAFMLFYNAGAAHFRDTVETMEWREASKQAVGKLFPGPVDPDMILSYLLSVLRFDTVESYVFFFLGVFISIAACWKGYNAFDPYPGYSKVAQDVLDARNVYIDALEDSIDTLAEQRDEARKDLTQAREEVTLQIRESVDALYGQQTLRAHLVQFLGQCDTAVNYLLGVYRDANRAARGDKPPACFDKEYAFAEFSCPTEDEDRRTRAEKQARQVSDMAEAAIRDIYDDFHQAVREHYEIDELEGNFIDRAKRFKPPSMDAVGGHGPQDVPDAQEAG